MLGKNDKTGGISVDTVDTAKGIGNVLIGIVAADRVCQRIFVVPLGRMHRHASGLVYHQNILILVADGKGEGSWGDAARTLCFFQADTQMILGMKSGRDIFPCSVQKNAVFGFL